LYLTFIYAYLYLLFSVCIFLLFSSFVRSLLCPFLPFALNTSHCLCLLVYPCLPACPPAYPSMYVCMYVCISACLSVFTCMYECICLSMYMSICRPIHLFLYMHIYLRHCLCLPMYLLVSVVQTKTIFRQCEPATCCRSSEVMAPVS
jgi:hypothetical protein